MADITVIRGDSYALRRPLWTFALVDDEGAPFDLRGCTIQTTYKPTITPLGDTDDDDSTAEITHELQLSLSGSIVYQEGLFLVGDAEDGELQERLTAAETAALSPATTLHMDLQLIDRNDEVFTWVYQSAIATTEGVTHREPATP